LAVEIILNNFVEGEIGQLAFLEPFPLLLVTGSTSVVTLVPLSSALRQYGRTLWRISLVPNERARAGQDQESDVATGLGEDFVSTARSEGAREPLLADSREEMRAGIVSGSVVVTSGVALVKEVGISAGSAAASMKSIKSVKSVLKPNQSMVSETESKATFAPMKTVQEDVGSVSAEDAPSVGSADNDNDSECSSSIEAASAGTQNSPASRPSTTAQVDMLPSGDEGLGGAQVSYISNDCLCILL